MTFIFCQFMNATVSIIKNQSHSQFFNLSTSFISIPYPETKPNHPLEKATIWMEVAQRCETFFVSAHAPVVDRTFGISFLQRRIGNFKTSKTPQWGESTNSCGHGLQSQVSCSKAIEHREKKNALCRRTVRYSSYRRY